MESTEAGFGAARRLQARALRPEVARAKAYLLDNLATNVPLRELARVATLSPHHLSRTFTREIGLPPHAFHLRARVDRAKQLIAQGWPIGRVAQATGFFDQSHLRRHFLRAVGTNPTEYAAHHSGRRVEAGVEAP